MVEKAIPKDRVYASGIAGGFAGGSVGALTSTFDFIATVAVPGGCLTCLARREG